jgi:hypothetical protein
MKNQTGSSVERLLRSVFPGTACMTLHLKRL